MADTKAADAGNTAAKGGDHDRVAMLSLNKDGTPDQHDPEIIGDKEFAVEAAKRQFADQAVSALDHEQRRADALAADGAEEVGQDPTIEKRQKEHEKAAEAAEKRAESVVNALHKGD